MTGARNRQKGKEWERQLRNGFRDSGLDTEHHRDTGTKDEGDLIVRAGKHHFVIEAKNAKLNVTGFLGEAEVEAKHYAESRPYVSPEKIFGVVEWKRPGKTFKGGVVMMDQDTFIRILRELEAK